MKNYGNQDNWELLEPFWWIHPVFGATQRIEGKWYVFQYNTNEKLGGFGTNEDAMIYAERLYNEQQS